MELGAVSPAQHAKRMIREGINDNKGEDAMELEPGQLKISPMGIFK